MHTLSFGPATRERSAGSSPSIALAFTRVQQALTASGGPILVLLGETVLAAASYSLAAALMAPTYGAPRTQEFFRSTLVLVVGSRLAASLALQLYRRSLRYANALDLVLIAKAILASSICAWAFADFVVPGARLPVSLLVVDAPLLLLFWAGLHFGARVWRAQHAASRREGKCVVIVGAGDAGIAVLRELALDSEAPCRPVALVDDDPAKWGRRLYDVPIKGGTRDLARVAAETEADEILVCIPSATHSQMHDILNACRRSNLPVRSLPSLSELIRGPGTATVSRRDLRSPRIEELLQREQVRVDPHETERLVAGKTILVTGAGGSIGSELCRQIAAAGPRMLLLLDKSENSLFYVNRETAQHLGSARAKPFLVDVLDVDRLRRIFANEKPDVVFHAAAHKHVAMLELHPEEAIRNNVLGTRHTAEAAFDHGVSRFVNISTDKAVSPCNYMGLSKKLAEMCVRELALLSGGIGPGTSSARAATKFSSVRFGNVAGSTGSVLRLFWDQIQKGEPVRVTDPRATRYFMSIPEAVHLILRAATLGHRGETFVLDMGEPLNICELAKTMMLFAGLKPNEDARIEFVGLQSGEKINEELWEENERAVPTESDRILVARRPADGEGILEKIEQMGRLLAHCDTQELLGYVDETFPEFSANRIRMTREQFLPPQTKELACAGVARISSLEAAVPTIRNEYRGARVSTKRRPHASKSQSPRPCNT